MKKLKLNRKSYLFFAIILLILGGWYWKYSTSRPEYESYTVEANDIQEVLELSGKISAENSATLRFSAGGLVTYLGAKEGDSVKKWQTLASVDTRQLNKTLTQKLNLYAIQRGTFDQTIDDNDNSIPEGDLARTLDRLLAKNQYQLENTVLDVEYQDLAIKLSRITSPITGILIHSPISVANVQVAATDTWIVVDPESLEFVADVDETDITKVSVGQEVIISLDAFPDQEIVSSISSVSFAPKETSTGTTYEVKIKLSSNDMDKLRLGLNGTASVILSKKNSVRTLPTAAMTLLEGTSAVTILDNGKYTTKKINTGIENNGNVEIVDGLEVGDHVYVEK